VTRQWAWLAVALTLAGCDQLKERAGIPDPAKIEAEGKAIGSACRQAGWGIEDCFRLNQDASKSAMFAGWKDMNEYMMKNNMEAAEPSVSPTGQPMASKKSKKKMIELDPIDKNKVEKPNKAAEGESGESKEPPAH